MNWNHETLEADHKVVERKAMKNTKIMRGIRRIIERQDAVEKAMNNAQRTHEDLVDHAMSPSIP